MSEQQAETTDLQRLTDTMQSLTEYTQALRNAAAAFAYMLPGDWQGQASQSFIAMFEQWAAGADGLIEGASTMHGLAERSLTAYTGAEEFLAEQWTTFDNALG